MLTSREVAQGRAAYEFYHTHVFPSWVQMPAWDDLTLDGQIFWAKLAQAALLAH